MRHFHSTRRSGSIPMAHQRIWVATRVMQASTIACMNGRVMMMVMGCAKCIATRAKDEAQHYAPFFDHFVVFIRTISFCSWLYLKLVRMPNALPPLSYSAYAFPKMARTLISHEPS